MKNLFILLLLIGSTLTAQYKTDTLFRPVDIFNIKDDAWVENIISKMTVEEKAGQLVFPIAVGQYYSDDSNQYQRLLRLVQDYKVGGFIFGMGNVYDQAILTNKLQEISEVPLLITADFERGAAQRAIEATMFPYNMGIGAADDTALTYLMGKIIALEGQAIGVHQNYAPVADINNNPFNPIINVRSFGEDAGLVKRHSNAFLRGIQDGGMIATTKHFPGHGNTSSDSHLEIPTISGTREELYGIEFAPFISNINEGVMSCMISHLHVKALDEKVLPSTLSPAVIQDLLKKEFGFTGLIVTDAMNMHAITNNYSTTEATILAVLAGNDAILFPDSAEVSVQAIIDGVKSGRISIERIDESVRKILLAKKYMGLDTCRISDIEKIASLVGTREHRETALMIARKSITALCSDGTLPLKNGEKVLHISLLDNEREKLDNIFISEFRKRMPGAGFIVLYPSSHPDFYKEALENAGQYDKIILSVYLKVRAFNAELGLNDKQQDFIKELLENQSKVVFASHGNPYIISNFPETKTYLCNYGDAEVSETALAEALFGEIEISGRLPVSIPGTSYKFGSGLVLNKTAAGSFIPQENFSEIGRIINKAINDSAFPGAVVLVLKDDQILFEKGFGTFTYEKNSPAVNTNTIFDLASVSKVIGTTTAVMLCYDRKLFDLDDLVTKYIPEFGQNGKGHIRIKNLLLHNTGLPAWKKYYEMYNSAEEVLKDIYASGLDFETGTKMVYSDLGMITMGKIIEKVTGKHLDEFCKDEIFVPLGMTNTFYNPSDNIRTKIAPTELDNYWRKRQLQGEVHDETASLLNGVAGHAGLFSNARDLSILLNVLLNKGKYNGKTFIQPETVTMFTRKYSSLSSRALGWDTRSAGSSSGKLFSSFSYGHTGYTGTSVWSDPLKNLAVILLTNRVYPTRNNLKISKVRPLVHDAVVRATEK